MTVESDIASASYAGTGTTGPFPIPFYFLVDTDLKVTQKSGSTGAIVTLVLNSDFTVTGAGSPSGGALTLSTALGGGTTPDQIYIERDVDAVQETEYPDNSKFPASSHEKALDRLTMLSQQTRNTLGFSLIRDPLGSTYDLANSVLVNTGTAVGAGDVPGLSQVQQIASTYANGIPGGIGTFIQTGAGALASNYQDRMRNAVVYGDHSTLQQSLDEAFNSGKPFLGKKGASVTINSPLTIHPNILADFNGMTIIAGPGITSGPAVIVDGSISTTSPAGAVDNLVIYRPLVSNHADTSSNVDGLSLRGGSGQVSDMAWRGLKIFGFRDNLRIDGPNCYLNHFYNPQIGFGWRRNVAVYANSNSNENISFFGGSIFDCNNTSFNGVGVYIDPASSGVDMSFHGTSFDYCDISCDLRNVKATFVGCHFENNNNNPHIISTFVSGNEKPSILILGGQLDGGPGVTTWTGISTESANGRPALIQTVNGGSNIVVDGTKVGAFVTGSPYQTELVNVSDGIANRRLDLRPVLDAFGTSGSSIPLDISNSINNLYVAGAGSGTGWKTDLLGSGNTLSADSGDFAAPDTGSRVLTCANGNSGGVYQIVPLAGMAGKQLVLKSRIKGVGLTAGGGTHRLQFYAPDGTTIFSDVVMTRQVTTNGSFQEVSYITVVPNGAVQVRIWDWILAGTNIGAVLKFSRERLWLY